MNVQTDIQVVARVNFEDGELHLTTEALRTVLDNSRVSAKGAPSKQSAQSENQTQRLLEALAEACEQSERLQRHLQDTGAFPLPSVGW